MTAVDLFGEPIDPRRGLRGRPRHMPTPQLRALVARLHAMGFNQLTIAKTIGITAPTLRLNYAAELNSTSRAGCARLNSEE